MLSAYFDESGTHGGSAAVAIAGYMATCEAWVEFEARWLAILSSFGLENFHMTDFVRGGEPYNRLSASDRDYSEGVPIAAPAPRSVCIPRLVATNPAAREGRVLERSQPTAKAAPTSSPTAT
jgi:hypothetical protein